MTLAIREPLPADIEQIARVHTRGWRDTYGHLLPERFYDQVALARRISQWTRIVTEPNASQTVRVAEMDHAIVGFILAGPPQDEDAARDLELYALYVDTAQHGTGAGQALLDDALGDRPAELWVATGNARARAFYRRNGFRRDGATKVEEHLENLAEIRIVR